MAGACRSQEVELAKEFGCSLVIVMRMMILEGVFAKLMEWAAGLYEVYQVAVREVMETEM